MATPGRSMPPSAALDGSAPRRQAPPQQQGSLSRPLKNREMAMAKRYGLNEKQAREAIADFEKRNQAGRSQVTPTVQQIVDQQEGR